MKKNFMIGDEWIFYKLYCGYKSSDRVLTESLKPLAEELLNKKIIDEWFFIRYSDPDLHLRVRFHYTDIGSVGTIINSMNSALSRYVNSGIVSKVMIDVYERELNRYGQDTIEMSEKMFCTDSIMIINLISFLSGKGESSENIRWKFGVKAVDRLLSDFGYNLNGKLEAIERMRDGFNKEFGIENNVKKQLNDNYREVRKEIEELMKESGSGFEYSSVFNNLLDFKSASTQNIIAELLDPAGQNCLKVDQTGYIASLSHMMLNRLFRSNQRAQEMVIYNYLWKYYDTVRAKQKYMPKVKELQIETTTG